MMLFAFISGSVSLNVLESDNLVYVKKALHKNYESAHI